MRDRSCLGALLLIGIVVPLTSCGVSASLTSITVNPGTVTTSESSGLQIDFTAIGNYTRPGHAAITKDLTDQVTWTSSWPQFVTIAPTGVATVTGYGFGTGAMYASAPGFHGNIVGTATFNISQPPPSTGAIVKLSLYPAAHSTGTSVQFVAVGQTADGQAVKLTGEPTWISTDNQIATIDQNTGVISKLGIGRTTITAVYHNPDGTTAIGKTSFNVTGDN